MSVTSPTGKCVDSFDPDLWFSGSKGDQTLAIRLCNACPIQAQCLEEGLDFDSGIWGGTTPEERSVLRKRLSKALPITAPKPPTLRIVYCDDKLGHRCSECKLYKDHTLFSPAKARSCGYASYCLPCRRALRLRN